MERFIETELGIEIGTESETETEQEIKETIENKNYQNRWKRESEKSPIALSSSFHLL